MLKGKVAVVTGAGNGIGLGIARLFAENGVKVFVADVDGVAASAAADAITQSGGLGVPIGADVSNESDTDRLFAIVARECHRLDILVNNAGIVIQAAAEDLTLEQWNKTLAVNLTGPFLCSKAAMKLMTDGGSIINIASVGSHASARSFTAYAASKSGLHGLTRSLAVEWGKRNIRVNSISPGSVGTAMTQKARAFDPEAAARREARVPLPRNGCVDDIAKAALFFASDASEFITGRDLAVDGGILARHPGFVE